MWTKLWVNWLSFEKNLCHKRKKFLKSNISGRLFLFQLAKQKNGFSLFQNAFDNKPASHWRMSRNANDKREMTTRSIYMTAKIVDKCQRSVMINDSLIYGSVVFCHLVKVISKAISGQSQRLIPRLAWWLTVTRCRKKPNAQVTKWASLTTRTSSRHCQL